MWNLNPKFLVLDQNVSQSVEEKKVPLFPPLLHTLSLGRCYLNVDSEMLKNISCSDILHGLLERNCTPWRSVQARVSVMAVITSYSTRWYEKWARDTYSIDLLELKPCSEMIQAWLTTPSFLRTEIWRHLSSFPPFPTLMLASLTLSLCVFLQNPRCLFPSLGPGNTFSSHPPVFSLDTSS